MSLIHYTLLQVMILLQKNQDICQKWISIQGFGTIRNRSMIQRKAESSNRTHLLHYIVSSTIKGRSQAGRLTRRGKLPLPDGFPISLHSTTKPPAVSELRTIIGTPRHYCHPRPDNPPCDKIATSAPTHSPPKCSCCVIPRNARTTLPLAGDPPLKSAIHHR